MSFWRNNSLSITLLTASALTIGGMFFTGLSVYNNELADHGRAAIGAAQYAVSGHFLSALFENWESEFLQMAAYVCLTAFLFQKGSAESDDPEDPEKAEREAEERTPPAERPWPLAGPALVRILYSYSLGITLGLLFIASFALHLRYSFRAELAEAALHGDTQPEFWPFLAQSEFWFESFQNWQSEFLSTAILVLLSIFLKFRGSPESKPLASPVSETGA